jgi:hypothetical protein
MLMHVPTRSAATLNCSRGSNVSTIFGVGALNRMSTAYPAAKYARSRGSASSARRDMEDLRAAINLHAKEGFHRGTVHVVLPDKSTSRTRCLTRSEAAALLYACLRAREVQTIHRGAKLGERTETSRRTLLHIARFILIGLYTGTRAGTIAAASLSRQHGRSRVVLDNGIFYRLADGARETKRRQPPVPIPPRLLAHLRRWAAKGIIRDAVIERNGDRLAQSEPPSGTPSSLPASTPP